MHKTEFIKTLNYLVKATGKHKDFNVEASESLMFYKNVVIHILVEKKDTAHHDIVIKVKKNYNLNQYSKELFTTYKYFKGIDDKDDMLRIATLVQKNINKVRRMK